MVAMVVVSWPCDVRFVMSDVPTLELLSSFLFWKFPLINMADLCKLSSSLEWLVTGRTYVARGLPLEHSNI